MADEHLNTITPTPTPVSPEPVAAPVAAPIVEVTPTPAPAPTPVSEAPKASVEAPTAVAPKAETLLADGLDKKVEPPNTASAASNKVPEVKPEQAPIQNSEGGQSAEPAPPPTEESAPVAPKYDPWTLPEGISLDNDRVGKFTELLSELELQGKASHDVVQQFGQKAVDFYLAEVKNYGENLTKYYQTVWEKQKQDWREATLKDPEIGGQRLQMTLDSVLGFIRTHGGTADQQKEFRDVMETSGLGNHPAIIRLFANAALAYKEGRPLAAPKPVQEAKSKTETLYGKRA